MEVFLFLLTLGVVETHRRCEPVPVAVAALQGKSPRETRATLSRTLGPPTVETNQLPDGGTFARLELADLQDGVTQRYTWGEGALDVVFHAGRAQLIAFHFDEFETYAKGRRVLPCEPMGREEWGKTLSLALPKRASSSQMGRGQVSFRFDVRPWMVRLRCAGSDKSCTDASVYVPGESELPEPPPVAESLPEPTAERVPLIASPPPPRAALRGRPNVAASNAKRRTLKGR
jgi:hypothetical protein